MAYKDKDKQREANRQASKKYRDSMTGKGMTKEGMMPKGMTKEMSNEGMTARNGIVYVIPSSKRGKDIKCFEDLPPDIQKTINTISENEAEHKRRTAIAINYQHMTCSVTKGGVKYR